MFGRRRLEVLTLLGAALAVTVLGLTIYAYDGREGGERESVSTSPKGSLVLTWVRGGSVRIRRSCGFIRAHGRPVAVDIAEGRFPLTCGSARMVMSRYLARRFVRYGSLRHARLTFECYEARPDGVGWDYHCMYVNDDAAGAAAYVDVGAGRRPHR
jgi:hypothetical protein